MKPVAKEQVFFGLGGTGLVRVVPNGATVTLQADAGLPGAENWKQFEVFNSAKEIDLKEIVYGNHQRFRFTWQSGSPTTFISMNSVIEA